MVKFTAVVLIEGKSAISCGSEIISTDAIAWIALLKGGHESAVAVAYNPHRACSRAIEHDVIKIATVVVVESEGKISGRSKVVSGNAEAWITLLVDRCESICWSAHVELRYDVSLE